MYDIRSIFRRRSAKDLAKPKGLPEAEINEIMGRDIIPNWLQDTALALTNRFDFDDRTRRSPGVIKFNTIADPIDMKGEGTEKVIDILNQPVDCYYKLVREHSTRKVDYEYGSTTPLTLIVGLAVANEQRNTRPDATGLVTVDFDHRDKSNIEIKSINTSALGLASPNSFEEKTKALRVIGTWLQSIDKGEMLNPHECREELKQAAGLSDGNHYGTVMTGIKDELKAIWEKQKPRAEANKSRTVNQRLKRMYAAMKRRPKP